MPRRSNLSGIVSTFTFKKLLEIFLAYEGLPLFYYDNQKS